MTKKILVTPENPDGVLVDLTKEEIDANKEFLENETQKQNNLNQKEIDAKNGNQKLLDMGLTQAEATALTGYKPPEEE
tara:strand:- start:232 stop:465 length:234 start_codon:yes stop_codon:yes gene_type:complete